MEKEEIIEAEVLKRQIEQIEQYFLALEQNIIEIEKTIEYIEYFSKMEGGEKIIFPIVKGIFAEAIYKKKDKVKINVGNGVVVEKTLEDSKRLLEEKKKELEQQHSLLIKEYDKMLLRLNELVGKIEKEKEKGGKDV